MSRLNDKVALVTGAARGIGAAIVKAFIGESARVWLTDVSVDAGRKHAAELGRGVGIPAAAAYASSKAAVRNHTKTVALWCAQESLAIRCNSIHPAAILTPMWEPVLGSGPDREARMAAFVKDTPLRRFGTAEGVASMATFLASDEAPYVTGSEFNIDGGLLAGTVATPSR